VVTKQGLTGAIASTFSDEGKVSLRNISATPLDFPIHKQLHLIVLLHVIQEYSIGLN